MSFEVKTYDLNYGFDLNHPTVRFVRDVDVPYNTLTTTAINKQVPVSVEFPCVLHSNVLHSSSQHSNTLHSKSLHNDGVRWYGPHASWHPRGMRYWY